MSICTAINTLCNRSYIYELRQQESYSSKLMFVERERLESERRQRKLQGESIFRFSGGFCSEIRFIKLEDTKWWEIYSIINKVTSY